MEAGVDGGGNGAPFCLEGKRTVAVVMQVEELVVPLCYYAQGILEEGDNNQESADHGHVSVQPSAQPHSSPQYWPGKAALFAIDVRLDGLGSAVEKILDLASLLPDHVESTAALLGRLVHAATVAGGAHAVAPRVSSHCCHVDCLGRVTERSGRVLRERRICWGSRERSLE